MLVLCFVNSVCICINNAEKGKIFLKLRKIVLCYLVDMEATYAEYEEWSEHGVSETVMHLYKKALRQMERCKPFEASLVTDLH